MLAIGRALMIDPELVLLQALAQAKAHYGQADWRTYYQLVADQLVMRIVLILLRVVSF